MCKVCVRVRVCRSSATGVGSNGLFNLLWHLGKSQFQSLSFPCYKMVTLASGLFEVVQECVALSVWHTVGSPCLGMSGHLSDAFTVFGHARYQCSHGELEAWLVGFRS